MLPYVVALPSCFYLDPIVQTTRPHLQSFALTLARAPPFFGPPVRRAQPESRSREGEAQRLLWPLLRRLSYMKTRAGFAQGCRHEWSQSVSRGCTAPRAWRRLVRSRLAGSSLMLLPMAQQLTNQTSWTRCWDNDTLWSNCEQNLLVSSFNIPTLILAIAMLKRLGTKRLQVWGLIDRCGLAALCPRHHLRLAEQCAQLCDAVPTDICHRVGTQCNNVCASS